MAGPECNPDAPNSKRYEQISGAWVAATQRRVTVVGPHAGNELARGIAPVIRWQAGSAGGRGATAAPEILRTLTGVCHALRGRTVLAASQVRIRGMVLAKCPQTTMPGVLGTTQPLGLCNTSHEGCHSFVLRSRADTDRAAAVIEGPRWRASRSAKPAGAMSIGTSAGSEVNGSVVGTLAGLCPARTQVGRNRTKVALGRSEEACFRGSIQTG